MTALQFYLNFLFHIATSSIFGYSHDLSLPLHYSLPLFFKSTLAEDCALDSVTDFYKPTVTRLSFLIVKMRLNQMRFDKMFIKKSTWTHRLPTVVIAISCVATITRCTSSDIINDTTAK